jgi:exosortase D (VPLPA-CTERM-specific)
LNFQSSPSPGNPCRYQYPAWMLGVLPLLLGLLYAGFKPAIDQMVGQWGMAEFSHGYLIPFLSAFLAWQRRNQLRSIEFQGSWYGLAVVAAGIGLDWAGRLASLFVIQHVALLIVVGGLVVALAGWQALRILRVPFGILVFMIPLPEFLLYPLSSELQLISSTGGVWLIRLAGVSVFLEGNVIDLGGYKLEVAQACSGLRYLLPLMTLAFLMACFYHAAFWKRATVFLSSIPITLAINSLRIGAIGVMVDRWGSALAEGLVHEVQGWMMFMLSTTILVLEVVLLARLGRDRRPWRELFGVEIPAALPADLPIRRRTLSTPLVASGLLVLVFSISALAMPARRDLVPARETFASFPLGIGGWSGRREALEEVYLDQLKLDDYLLANYTTVDAPPINLYVAWYDTQSSGEATHSPRACLPGGGWRIEDLRQISLAQVKMSGQPLRANRALIRYENQRQLVYYWFMQRGRVVTNEYLIKWYLLIDSITKHRTDGALVRLIVPIPASLSVDDADRKLQAFVVAVAPRLERYLPN